MLEAYMYNFNEIFKMNNQALKNIFKKQINRSFLIAVKSIVFETIKNDIPKYYDFSTNNPNYVSGGQDMFFEYYICKHIIGLHHSNSIFLTNKQVRLNENKDSYKKKLAEQVIENIKLRLYGSSFFRKHPITHGESFIYYHTPYNLFVMCTKINHIITTNQQKNPRFIFYTGISNKGLAALSLLEDNFLGSAYPLCRGLIEIYIKMLVVSNTNSYDSYSEFLQHEINYHCYQHYDETFNLKFKNKIKTECDNKKDFLNFGWVDSIPKYHHYVKRNPYSIQGLIEFLKHVCTAENHDMLNNLSDLYKLCNAYTHGSIDSSNYPVLHYFEISLMLYSVIYHTYQIVCKDYKEEKDIGSVDICVKTEKDFNLLLGQYNIRNTDKLNDFNKKYYSF